MTVIYSCKLAHINDTHSHFDPNRIHFNFEHKDKALSLHTHSGGYSRLAFQIEKARQQALDDQQSFLFLHGGDSFQGTLYFREFKGKANAHLLNLLKPDAMVLGNHEIDAGNGPVLSFLNNIDFPLLAGNMDLSQEDIGKTTRLRDHKNLLDFDPQTQTAKVLLKPLQDKTLAIVGITLDQMKEIARPDPDTHFVDAIETTQRTVDKLKKQGIDHIIILSHLGLTQDRALAQQIPDISLIIGGHSHSLQDDFTQFGLPYLPYGERVNTIPILHAGKYAETLGIADIEFNAEGRVTLLNGHNYFMLDKQFMLESAQGVATDDYAWAHAQLSAHPSILWDDEAANIRQTIDTLYRPTLIALEEQIINFVPKNLIHTRLPSKALPHGSEISPWISRSIYHETRILDETIDFALHNAGGVRQSLAKGHLTLAEVVGRLLPFDLPLVKYQIQGRYLYQAIESSINHATNNSVIGTGAGSFPYAYGLRYFYDGRRPLGQRITQLDILIQEEHHSKNQQESWKPVNVDHYYVGVSSEYTASGKEGYQALQQAKWQRPISELSLAQAFIQFMQKEQDLEQTLPLQVHYTSHH
ncbi:bifunctional metallophosphatase/5'-nucleotidase [Shewanella surugensis]|uniref:Bifunctional metallophosphatase/5'-nucleotidase n=1 Tax=Shewanella surugensis TaxID=212020 RepID=A0ABT0LBD5_9GAMM|nr:bifunctional metallophosphatase/5'-nucleotidase [Shewanella surugensis]MCL1125014.1 bifunctional metallophosphatase/5'-nucleotidase [Shewanella surugensis]